MIYRFGEHELDLEKVELRTGGASQPLEPQVFALLAFLIENRDRLVTKDEIIEKIWNGRIVSDSAIASRVKSARQALGDDGRAQRFIRTAHGLGFRFVAEVTEAAGAATRIEIVAPAETLTHSPALEPEARPTLAVLPFRLVGAAGPYGAIAEALPQDLITALSRLRWLFVIARASSFRFHSSDADIARVREAFNVRYCLTGTVEVLGKSVTLSVELLDTTHSGVIWSERFRTDTDGVHETRDRIVRDVLAALELQIPLNEAKRARLKSPEHLDAWSAYHLGLQHMYRFNKDDNTLATHLFERAVSLDPGFARAYAGLSFTHFQDAFLHYANDVKAAADRARRFAEMCLELDPVDPFGNFTMGRSFWLKGDGEAALPWLDRANTLNPNYAQARYANAFTYSMLGEHKPAHDNAALAIKLSPLDPLLYGMFGVRALADLVAGRYTDAVQWVEQSARSPGAHGLIQMIAALSHSLNGDEARARHWAQSAQAKWPQLRRADFARAFPVRDPALMELFLKTLERYGF
ncbi:MAG: winged helix-turn-helix domain-containing protein [Hyphomonadaceae bacterium]|nr:winged helix-turn-helix domain-containing protein [Hyphomonadaceae bacterium]